MFRKIQNLKINYLLILLSFGFLLLFCQIFILPSRALALSQEPQETKVDLDALFKKARSLAFEGNWEEARKICDDILRKNPDYHEVRVFLGRLYAWDKKYDLARKEMQSVIKAQPDYLDARNALIDVEFWSSNLTRALSICEESLKLFPGNNELLLRRARISVSLENFEEATTTINLILEKDSSHKEALKLLERIRFTERIQSSTQEYKLSLNYRFDNFRREESRYGPWHLGSLELLGKFKFGSIIGRVNYASRDFGSGFKSGTQYEIDFYPVITSGLYAYLNAGYSSSSIFPKYRLGVELFKNLPLSYEISAGIRYLDFSSSSVIIYTGSLGKYYKNYWFSFRPFLTTKDSGLSVSGILLIRNYLKDANNFIGLLLGYGSSPVDLISLEDFERLDSFKIGLEMSRMLTSKLLIRCHVRFEREEYVLEEFGNRFILGIGLEQLILKK